MIEPTSPLPALAVLATALATTQWLAWRFGVRPASGRHASIDGLRGMLALAVFLCHACIWYFYARTGRWELPPSHLYTHFGQSGVALFFMISGFLFFSKLIDGRTHPIDWGRLFASRILRLTPLYLVMVALVAIAALVAGRGLQQPPGDFFKALAHWVGFTVMGAPDLNGIGNSWRLVAGVTWSLPYEWFFYLSLPVLALSVRVVPPVPYLLLGLATLVALAWWGPQSQHLASFLGGIAAALLVRIRTFRDFATKPAASLACLVLLASAVLLYPTAYAPGSLLLASMAFILIACGNSVFGLLTLPASRLLGDVAYGVYLLHGLLLFTTFGLLAHGTDPSSLSPAGHWLLMLAITPLLVLASYAGFRLVELPAMRRVPAVARWLRSRSGADPRSLPRDPAAAPRIDA